MAARRETYGTYNLERVISDIEFENQQYVKHIESERHAISNLENQVEECSLHIKHDETLITQLDDTIKTMHRQFTHNRSNIRNLKQTLNVVRDHEEAISNKLQTMKTRNEQAMNEHDQLILHYEEKWCKFKTSYESLPKASELLALQKKVDEIESLLETERKQRSNLESALMCSMTVADSPNVCDELAEVICLYINVIKELDEEAKKLADCKLQIKEAEQQKEQRYQLASNRRKRRSAVSLETKASRECFDPDIEHQSTQSTVAEKQINQVNAEAVNEANQMDTHDNQRATVISENVCPSKNRIDNTGDDVDTSCQTRKNHSDAEEEVLAHDSSTFDERNHVYFSPQPQLQVTGDQTLAHSSSHIKPHEMDEKQIAVSNDWRLQSNKRMTQEQTQMHHNVQGENILHVEVAQPGVTRGSMKTQQKTNLQSAVQLVHAESQLSSTRHFDGIKLNHPENQAFSEALKVDKTQKHMKPDKGQDHAKTQFLEKYRQRQIEEMKLQAKQQLQMSPHKTQVLHTRTVDDNDEQVSNGQANRRVTAQRGIPLLSIPQRQHKQPQNHEQSQEQENWPLLRQVQELSIQRKHNIPTTLIASSPIAQQVSGSPCPVPFDEQTPECTASVVQARSTPRSQTPRVEVSATRAGPQLTSHAPCVQPNTGTRSKHGVNTVTRSKHLEAQVTPVSTVASDVLSGQAFTRHHISQEHCDALPATAHRDPSIIQNVSSIESHSIIKPQSSKAAPVHNLKSTPGEPVNEVVKGRKSTSPEQSIEASEDMMQEPKAPSNTDGRKTPTNCKTPVLSFSPTSDTGSVDFDRALEKASKFRFKSPGGYDSFKPYYTYTSEKDGTDDGDNLKNVDATKKPNDSCLIGAGDGPPGNKQASNMFAMFEDIGTESQKHTGFSFSFDQGMGESMSAMTMFGSADQKTSQNTSSSPGFGEGTAFCMGGGDAIGNAPQSSRNIFSMFEGEGGQSVPSPRNDDFSFSFGGMGDDSCQNSSSVFNLF